MKLPLIYYGHPLLRKKALPVAKITPFIHDLVNDMVETMEAEKGIGLAAPQINQSLALFITRVPIQISEEEWDQGILRVFINPKILSYSQEYEIQSEACLSIPKLHGNVPRPFQVEVEATDLEGKKFKQRFEGLEARCILHENDHLNGVLYIDRVQGKERKELEPFLRQLKKKYT